MSSVAADLDAVPRAETAARSKRRPSVAVQRHLDGPTPWQRRDGLVAIVLAVIGAVVVGVCWNGASKEAAFRDQVGWTVGAFAGCGIFGLAGAYWLLVGFRRTRQCKAQLRADAAVVFGVADVTRSEVREAVESETITAAGILVIAEGMRLAHRPDCLLTKGKAVRPIAPSETDAHPRCVMCA